MHSCQLPTRNVYKEGRSKVEKFAIFRNPRRILDQQRGDRIRTCPYYPVSPLLPGTIGLAGGDSIPFAQFQQYLARHFMRVGSTGIGAAGPGLLVCTQGNPRTAEALALGRRRCRERGQRGRDGCAIRAIRTYTTTMGCMHVHSYSCMRLLAWGDGGWQSRKESHTWRAE